MDKEKLNNEEELEAVEETVEETVEEAVEEAEVVEETEETESSETEDDAEAEEVEEIAEEDSEEDEEAEVTIVQIWQCPECETVCDDEVCSTCGAQCELIEIEATAGEIAESPRKKIVAIACGAVVVVLAIVAVLWYFGVINPYEKDYIDVTGVTLEEVADQNGYSVSEFKKMYDLPLLMPKSTHENAAMNSISVGYYIEQQNKYNETYAPMYGQEYVPMTIESFRADFGLGDNITEKSTIGEAQDEMKLAVAFGVEGVDEISKKYQFTLKKVYYGFDDSVTLDTKYKEVRNIMDEKKRQAKLDPEKDAKDMEKAQAEALKVLQAAQPTPAPETQQPEAEPAPEEAPAE